MRAGAAHGRLRAGPAARKQAASFDPLEAAQWSAVSTLLARMSDEPSRAEVARPIRKECEGASDRARERGSILVTAPACG